MISLNHLKISSREELEGQLEGKDLTCCVGLNRKFFALSETF
jgi:hypothetical protein